MCISEKWDSGKVSWWKMGHERTKSRVLPAPGLRGLTEFVFLPFQMMASLNHDRLLDHEKWNTKTSVICKCFQFVHNLLGYQDKWTAYKKLKHLAFIISKLRILLHLDRSTKNASPSPMLNTCAGEVSWNNSQKHSKIIHIFVDLLSDYKGISLIVHQHQ